LTEEALDNNQKKISEQISGVCENLKDFT